MNVVNLSTMLSVIGCITVLTNIIVQVLKNLTWDRIPTNIVAFVVSEVLTLAAGAAYAQINSIQVVWYMVVAAVVVGLMVAYAAMFGFDKLKETIEDQANKK